MLDTLPHVAFGLRLVDSAASGRVYVLSKVVTGAWAVFEIAGGDLLLLSQCEVMPRMDSARCVALANTQRECFAAFRDFRRREIAAGNVSEEQTAG
jgi:hypothetical protein